MTALTAHYDEAFEALAPSAGNPFYDPDEVHCSICDGLGHGQPGWGPCPLEEDAAYRAGVDADEARFIF